MDSLSKDRWETDYDGTLFSSNIESVEAMALRFNYTNLSTTFRIFYVFHFACFYVPMSTFADGKDITPSLIISVHNDEFQ